MKDKVIGVVVAVRFATFGENESQHDGDNGEKILVVNGNTVVLRNVDGTLTEEGLKRLWKVRIDGFRFKTDDTGATTKESINNFLVFGKKSQERISGSFFSKIRRNYVSAYLSATGSITAMFPYTPQAERAAT